MSVERRRLPDRRIKSPSLLSKYIFVGRRRGARRQDEKGNNYVDRYELRYLVIISAILVLCFMDAYMTLTLIRFGGVEINPLLLLLMNRDIFLALVLKYLITVICLVYFLLHKNFKVFGRLRTHVLIYVVFFVYAALVSLELYWYAQISRLLASGF